MLDIQTALRVGGLVIAAAPVIHTEFNKYRLKRLEKGFGAASNDPVAKHQIERRSREGSEWKLWKSLCVGLGIALALVSFVLPPLFP